MSPVHKPSDGDEAIERDLRTRAAFWTPEWLFSLSFANLSFLKTWATLLQEDRNITPTAYMLAIVNVLLIALCIRGAYYYIDKRRNVWLTRLGLFACAGLLLLPVHAITTIYFADHVMERNVTYAGGLVLAALVIVSHRFRGIVMNVCLMLVVAVAVTFGQSVWRMATYDASRYETAAPPTAGEPRRPRLVWVLFDEWSYALTFPERPAGIALPELDRLVGESFHATHARAPGEVTRQSVPRLITGDMTTTAENMGRRPSIFTKAKQSGLRTAVVGWYIDYCGAYAASLDACWNPGLDAERNSLGNGPVEIGITQLRNLFENQFRSPFGQPVGAKNAYRDYRYNARLAMQAAVSPGYDLVYVHFNAPHGPFFYDAASGEFHNDEKPIVSLFRKDFSRYLDALQLVDRTVGELRQAMERSGIWDDTHLLLTSDHSFRRRTTVDGKPFDPRVPFIVRLAGSQAEAAYEEHTNTVIAPEMVMALLRREITTPEQLRNWMSQTRAATPALK